MLRPRQTSRGFGGLSRSRKTSEAGTAKFRFCPPGRIAVAMPTTLPLAARIGPPLDPGLIAALVCNNDRPGSNSRMPLISPSLSEFSSLIGLPITKTLAPTFGGTADSAIAAGRFAQESQASKIATSAESSSWITWLTNPIEWSCI